MKNFTAKQIAQTALLLALCIISQYFKSLSVYITGPIVNAILVIATLAVGPVSGIIISIIAPITAFFFTGSPIMAALPVMFPIIMISNTILVLFTYYFEKKKSFRFHLETGLILGSIVKAAFLGITVVLILLPYFGNAIAAKLPKPEALPKVLAAAKITFSVTQLITALIGSLIAWLIWHRLKKAIVNTDI
ncbi:MAG TPA: ECF transporter S component [Lachnospiraceae bacterium]|nr:ECF transporter S component [Lachnospiraceae bacterium]